MLTDEQRQRAAKGLENNQLLKEILSSREKDLIQQWRGSAEVVDREKAWTALRELDLLAGAIDDAIRKHSK